MQNYDWRLCSEIRTSGSYHVTNVFGKRNWGRNYVQVHKGVLLRQKAKLKKTWAGCYEEGEQPGPRRRGGAREGYGTWEHLQVQVMHELSRRRVMRLQRQMLLSPMPKLSCTVLLHLKKSKTKWFSWCSWWLCVCYFAEMPKQKTFLVYFCRSPFFRFNEFMIGKA